MKNGTKEAASGRVRIAVYGGSFNPPHAGHRNAALCAARRLKPDKLLIIPDFQAPHKDMGALTPAPEQRLELCSLAFAGVPAAEVSDLEIRRGGKSYTSDTLRALETAYPGAELWLLVGADMLETLETWHEADYILSHARIGAFARAAGQTRAMEDAARALKKKHGVEVRLLPLKPVTAASSQIRRALRFRGGLGLLSGRVYAYIVRNRLYGVRVNFQWLRKRGYAMLKPHRVPHVQGCEEEAVRLAKRWGADPDKAAEAAILHDCTKKEPLPEQLRLCEKYGIIPDAVEQVNGKLLHAKTGAAIAEREFGMCPEVVSAIRWHTTGRPGMTLLEKIMYMADYIEPTRDFPGVEPLRALAYSDLDRAMLLGLEMSLEDIRSRGEEPHTDSLTAVQWFAQAVGARQAAQDGPA